MGFVGLYTGLSGIRAAQAGLDVSAHNIANANTPGYTRQRVELQASAPYRSPVGWIGTGATVQDIVRLRDQFLDDRFRASIGDATQQGVRADFLTSMEDLTNEPDNGLTVRIERLWDAAETWSNNPADAASRRQVLTELSSIADGFQSTAAAWDRLGEDYGERRDTVVGSINQLLTDLHDLNVRMTGAQAHRIGPDLNDQRDQMLDQLAEMLGTVARPTPDGGVRITLNGVELLGPDTQTVAPVVEIDGDGNVVVTDGTGAAHAPIPYAEVAGELGGLQHILQEDLPTWRGQLDVLAVGLADAINDINTGTGVATGAQLARAAEHGVSIDEEMVGLVRYQRALEANARVMTTVDQALDTWSTASASSVADREEDRHAYHQRGHGHPVARPAADPAPGLRAHPVRARDRQGDPASPSDDPAGARRAMSLRAAMQTREQEPAQRQRCRWAGSMPPTRSCSPGWTASPACPRARPSDGATLKDPVGAAGHRPEIRADRRGARRDRQHPPPRPAAVRWLQRRGAPSTGCDRRRPRPSTFNAGQADRSRGASATPSRSGST
jgi:flagellar hook-associated protein FlgK